MECSIRFRALLLIETVRRRVFVGLEVKRSYSGRKPSPSTRCGLKLDNFGYPDVRHEDDYISRPRGG